jgi:Secretion system C-terminal sorting domain
MSLVVDPSDNVWLCGPISSSASKAFKLNGATGIEMVETGVIPGQVRHIDTDAAGNVFLRGQSLNSFTLNGVTCPANSVLGGNTTNWTGKLNTNGIAQWFHVPDQGHLGFSPWQHANQAAAPDGRCYVEAYSDMHINGDTISTGANQRGLYLLGTNGAPVWWTRLNQSGILQVEDMATDPFGNCWVTGTCVGILDLLDTIVEHTGFFAFHIGANGNVLQRVFGPTVLHTYSVDAVAGLAVFGGEYSSTISFGTHQIIDNLRGLFVARYEHPLNVSVPEQFSTLTFSAFPNPAQDHVRLTGLPQEACTVEVLNAQGQLLQRMEAFRAEQDVIALSQLPAGPLFVRVRTAGTEASVRIIHVP